MNLLNKYFVLIFFLSAGLTIAQFQQSHPKPALPAGRLVSGSQPIERMLKSPLSGIPFKAAQVQHDSLEKQFNFAKNLYEKENYFDAITEFKRFMFFDSTEFYNSSSYEYIAKCYKEGGFFNEAIQYFTQAEINAIKPDDIYRIKIEIVRVNILRRTTDNSLKLLDELESDNRWINKKDEINYWKGWAYIFSDEWDKATLEFFKISPDHELKILCDETFDKKYSVTFAKIASVILPGTGQFYTGHYLSGLLSLGWCTLWGYLSVNSFIEDRIFDGLAIANFLWFRFYHGNLQNAEQFAVEKNIQISNETLNYLQNHYKGIRP